MTPSGYVTHRQPIWKGKGLTERAFDSATEALQAAGADVEVKKTRLYWKSDESIIDGPEFGKFQEIEGFGLVRDATPSDPKSRYIATVTSQYQPIQQRDFAEMLDVFPKTYPLEMIGLMGRFNERVMFGFNMGEHDVGGFPSEQSKRYCYIDNANDGGSGIHMKVVDMRMWCLNQNIVAQNAASFRINIKHTQGALFDTSQWLEYIVRLEEGIAEQEAVFDRMATTQLTFAEEQVGEIINRVYTAQAPALVQKFGVSGGVDLPEAVDRARNSYAAALERMTEYRIEAYETYEKICDEFPHIGGTQWALYNAITEQENWRPAGRDTGASGMETVLRGDRAATMQRAYHLTVNAN